MNSKKLHLHALPVVMLSVLAIVVLSLAASKFITSSGQTIATQKLLSSLTTPVICIQSTADGLATISGGQAQDPIQPPKPGMTVNIPPAISPTIQNSGQSIQIQLINQQLATHLQ